MLIILPNIIFCERKHYKMIKKPKISSLFLILSLALWGLSIPAAQAADNPSFVLQSDEEQPGADGEVQFTVLGYDLADAYAYELRLTFDPLRLRFKQAENDNPGFSAPPIVQDGRLAIAHTKIGPVPGSDGDLTLGVLTFEAIAGGIAEVTLEEVRLVDSELAMTVHAVGTVVQIDNGEETLPEPAVGLNDIAGHWAEEDILKAVALGWVEGYGDGTFRPQNEVTRAEFTAMLVRAQGLPTEDGAPLPFADNDAIPAWAKPYVSAATGAGLLTGYEDQTFRADNRLTRAEMATIVIRSSGLPVAPEAVPEFADAADIPAWAHPYIAAGAEAGLIAGRGNNRFVAHEHTTRAEAVKIILNLLERE